MNDIDILVLVAGTNEPSNADALADAFIQGIHQHKNIHVEKRRLRTLDIKHFTLDFYEESCSQEEDFCMLQELIQRAKGVVIATPIWNFSVPAHLKNLIDRMGSFALDATRSKGTLGGTPFFFIYTGGAPYIAWKSLMRKTTSHLPESIRYFGGTPIDHHFEGKCTEGKGKFGLVVDERPQSLATVRSHGYKFAQIVRTFADTGKLPVRQKAISNIFKWGNSVLKKIT